MARTERNTIHNATRQQAHRADKSRKPAQRKLNQAFRRQTRQALRSGFEAPAFRSGQVDRVVC